jgi:LytS/YehU family sensor histidine kinase
MMMPLGIAISHLYRLFIIRGKLITAAIPVQLGAMILFSVVKAMAFFLMVIFLARSLNLPEAQMTPVEISEYVLNYGVVFFLWNMLYFGFQYFENYKVSEINALKHLAASRESDLNNLKAQLNPHFIFNCMNSIRALIDENPANAKAAVTMLSNILRNTLLIDKSKEIKLSEELKLVRDYLDLEKIRFEERLNYVIEVDPQVQNCFVPPFIVQSQVENAVKHGISRLPGRGLVKVEARIDQDALLVKVSNTGNINSQQPLTGVGFMNSIQRLELLYGKQGQISIEELDDMVVVDINIPTKKYESNHH